MAIEIECDSCHASYRVADTMAGKRLRCKQCGKPILVPAFASPSAGGGGGGGDDDDDPLKAIASLSESGSTDLGSARSARGGEEGDADAASFGTPAEREWTSDANPWDLSASMAEIRGRVSARPTKAFVYPLSDIIDAFLPWVLVVAFLGPAVVAAVRGVIASGDRQLTGWVQLGLAAALFSALVVPLTVRALRSAGRSFKFRVPDQAYFRIFAAFSVAVGMGSFFYTQLGWQGFYFGFGLGAFVGAMLLGVLFHLLPVEIFFTALFTVSFFLITSTVSYYAVTGSASFVNMLVASASNNRKTVAKATPKPTTPATKAAPAVPVVPLETPKPVETQPTVAPAPVTEKAPEPKAPTITFASTSPAVQATDVLEQPRDFEAVLYPLTTGGGGVSHMASIRRAPNGDDTVDFWTLDPAPAASGSLALKHQANASDHYGLSPAGDTLARLISWPKLAAQLISADSQKTRALELDPAIGTPEILGFTNADTLAVRYSRGNLSGLQLWDLKASGHPPRQMKIPDDCHGLAISPDGRLAACAVPPDPRDVRPVATVQVLDFAVAGRVTRKLSVTGLDPKLPLTVAGIAFSPDSVKVALLCENNDNILIEVWDLRAGSPRPTNEFVFPAGQLPLADLAHFPGRCFDYLPDGHAFLLYGNVVLDAASGATLASFQFPDVRSQQVLSPNTLQLEFQHPGEPRALARVTLNPRALDDARKK